MGYLLVILCVIAGILKGNKNIADARAGISPPAVQPSRNLVSYLFLDYDTNE